MLRNWEFSLSPDTCAWNCWGVIPAWASPAWNAGVWNAACTFAGTLTASSLNSSDRNTAVPMVPPVARKNVADEVATPMSRAVTLFCTAIIMVCMFRPTPGPIMKK